MRAGALDGARPMLVCECEEAGDANHSRCQEEGRAPGSLHGRRDPLVTRFPNSQDHLVNAHKYLKMQH